MKQEAIAGAIKEGLELITERLTEAIYVRIAALREFPEEEIREAIYEFHMRMLTCADIQVTYILATKELITKLKCLCEGQESTGECQHKNRHPKETPKFFFCEDCKQAIRSERNGEERREGFGRRKNNPRHSGNIMIQVRSENRRILKDRRK